MKNSLIVLAFFAAGVAVGYYGILPDGLDSSRCALWALYLLIAVVGFEFGHRSLLPTLRSMTLSSLVLPLCTIVGTLAMTVAVGLLMGRWSVGNYLALGSGFGYYSLSSVLIVDYTRDSLGIGAAAELGAIALLANIIREMIALIGAPVINRLAGTYATISAAGVTSMDVTLPVIARTCGDRAVPVAIIHGVVLEISVPLLVMLFCTL